jgi:hypothetical protein
VASELFGPQGGKAARDPYRAAVIESIAPDIEAFAISCFRSLIQVRLLCLFSLTLLFHPSSFRVQNGTGGVAGEEASEEALRMEGDTSTAPKPERDLGTGVRG